MELLNQNLILQIYDCYRPQLAVDHLVRWTEDLDDTMMKEVFYPNVDKNELLHQGYIAAKSSHSRGSTVDLTFMPRQSREQSDNTSNTLLAETRIKMGTPFDYFDPRSHTDSPNISQESRRNRLRLKEVMDKHGFENLKEEWWHYTLRDEPFPDRYFNFPVE